MTRLITFILLFTSFLSYSQDFHVEIGGDNGGPGSLAQPWETIQHAMDNATPGSTVYIHVGVYNERLHVNVDGTPGNYITFTCFDNDNVAVDGAGLTDDALLEMHDVQFVAIERLRFLNNEQTDAIGILIDGVSDHVRVKWCDISNVNFSTDPNAPVNSSTNAQPLIVYGNEASHAITDLEIIGNEIFACRIGFSEGLAVNGNVDGFEITNNDVYALTNIGIDIIGHEGTCADPNLDQARNGVISKNFVRQCLSPYATAAGIYVDGGKDLIIEQNRVHHNQWGIEIGCENIGKTTDNVVVRNNFIYNNETAGLACGGYDFPNSGAVTNCTVNNNTFYDNDIENNYTGEMFLSYNTNLTITNNIFYVKNANGEMMTDENLAAGSVNTSMYNNLWYHPDGDGNIEFTYEGNYYSSLSAFQTGTGFGNSSVFSDPMLVYLGTNPDLHIQPGSPAEDFGNTTFSTPGTFDIDNGLRLADGNIDLGADEIDDHLSIEKLERNNFILYPNPAKEYVVIQLKSGVISHATISDLKGVILFEQNSSSSIVKIDNLESGIYIVQVYSDNGKNFTKRLIVQ